LGLVTAIFGHSGSERKALIVVAPFALAAAAIVGSLTVVATYSLFLDRLFRSRPAPPAP